MCGIFFVNSSVKALDKQYLDNVLDLQKWRGPDNKSSYLCNSSKYYLGHNRLTILDESNDANQPIFSKDGRYVMVFNGEIYNYIDLKIQFNLYTNTHTDSEVLIELYAILGENVLDYIEGMFAFVIYDTETSHWFSARDHLGIKPLYYCHVDGKGFAIASETRLLTELIGEKVNEEQLECWRLLRRPMPSLTYFDGVYELPPGSTLSSDSIVPKKYWNLNSNDKPFSQSEFEQLLSESVRLHLQNDFQTVGLLSGGLDSAIIAALSDRVDRFYTTGLYDVNEFADAQDTANILSKPLIKVGLSLDELQEAWAHLISLRREPLSVPNEGLIYNVCSYMFDSEKVVLTGEGADELLFGYDRIFRWAIEQGDKKVNPKEFLDKYGYSDDSCGKGYQMALDYINDLSKSKSTIEFLEDFFIHFHLPGLLKRMDTASMVASKEARVPFVSKKLFEYMYRKKPEIRLGKHSKIPARIFASKLGLHGAVSRKKIGFTISKTGGKDIYNDFQEFNLKQLGWH